MQQSTLNNPPAPPLPYTHSSSSDPPVSPAPTSHFSSVKSSSGASPHTAAASSSPSSADNQNTPSAELREEEINNAVRFLSHPSVLKAPDRRKRDFLRQKGLTEEEINEAFQRVKTNKYKPNDNQSESNKAETNEDAENKKVDVLSSGSITAPTVGGVLPSSSLTSPSVPSPLPQSAAYAYAPYSNYPYNVQTSQGVNNPPPGTYPYVYTPYAHPPPHLQYPYPAVNGAGWGSTLFRSVFMPVMAAIGVVGVSSHLWSMYVHWKQKKVVSSSDASAGSSSPCVLPLPPQQNKQKAHCTNSSENGMCSNSNSTNQEHDFKGRHQITTSNISYSDTNNPLCAKPSAASGNVNCIAGVHTADICNNNPTHSSIENAHIHSSTGSAIKATSYTQNDNINNNVNYNNASDNYINNNNNNNNNNVHKKYFLKETYDIQEALLQNNLLSLCEKFDPQLICNSNNNNNAASNHASVSSSFLSSSSSSSLPSSSFFSSSSSSSVSSAAPHSVSFRPLISSSSSSSPPPAVSAGGGVGGVGGVSSALSSSSSCSSSGASSSSVCPPLSSSSLYMAGGATVSLILSQEILNLREQMKKKEEEYACQLERQTHELRDLSSTVNNLRNLLLNLQTNDNGRPTLYASPNLLSKGGRETEKILVDAGEGNNHVKVTGGGGRGAGATGGIVDEKETKGGEQANTYNAKGGNESHTEEESGSVMQKNKTEEKSDNQTTDEMVKKKDEEKNKKDLQEITDLINEIISACKEKEAAKKSVGTLALILKNLVQNPEPEKYRKVNMTAPRFDERFGKSRKSAYELLEKLGFEKSKNFYIFKQDDMSLVKESKNLLESAFSSLDDPSSVAPFVVFPAPSSASPPPPASTLTAPLAPSLFSSSTQPSAYNANNPSNSFSNRTNSNVNGTKNSGNNNSGNTKTTNHINDGAVSPPQPIVNPPLLSPMNSPCENPSQISPVSPPSSSSSSPSSPYPPHTLPSASYSSICEGANDNQHGFEEEDTNEKARNNNKNDAYTNHVGNNRSSNNNSKNSYTSRNHNYDDAHNQEEEEVGDKNRGDENNNMFSSQNESMLNGVHGMANTLNQKSPLGILTRKREEGEEAQEETEGSAEEKAGGRDRGSEIREGENEEQRNESR